MSFVAWAGGLVNYACTCAAIDSLVALDAFEGRLIAVFDTPLPLLHACSVFSVDGALLAVGFV